MARIDIHIKRCHEQVLKDIEATKAEGEVAPDGLRVDLAIDAVKRRKKIKALEKLSVQMEKTLHELESIAR
jgi:hypothetical protein